MLMIALLLSMSYMETDAITPKIVGPTIFRVVASVLAVVSKRMQQLPTKLGPARHRGKDTIHKALETMCNNTTPRRSRKKRNVGSHWLKILTGFKLCATAFTQQRATGFAKGRNL